MSAAASATAPVTRLSARGLSRRFGERLALRPLDLDLGPGERVAVIGPNGAGKTTLLSILAGALGPSAGELRRAGDRLPGWVPQQPALYGKLTVIENLRLFARLERLADPQAAARRMLCQSGLEDRAEEQVGRLSGGSRQRVNIAIGLLSEPEVLLLDEPSSSLDPRQRERLWEFIASLAAHGTTVVFSTHNVAEAERYGERVLVLCDGELVFTGAPAALREVAGVPPGGDFEAAFVSFLHARGH